MIGSKIWQCKVVNQNVWILQSGVSLRKVFFTHGATPSILKYPQKVMVFKKMDFFAKNGGDANDGGDCYGGKNKTGGGL